MIELSRTTAPNAKRVVGAGTLALIPVGATEQHGPNLGMGTDYRIAEELAQRTAAAIGEAAVVTPALPFGLSEHHMFAAGTITLSPDVLEGVLTDIVRSLMRHGVRHFLFVNGHQGNMNMLGMLANRLHFEQDVSVAVAFWMAQARDVIEKHRRTKRWGHACEIETSVAMALTPDLVATGELEAGDLIEEYGAYADNYEPHALTVPRSFSSRTRNGAFGDARLATKEAGEEIVRCAVDRTVEFARDFLTRSAPAGTLCRTRAYHLAVVRQMSDRIAVLYLGKLVEAGERDEICLSPQHPCTQALLAAVPTIGRPQHTPGVLSGEPPSTLRVPVPHPVPACP
jgi:creatinine amidohydrolase